MRATLVLSVSLVISLLGFNRPAAGEITAIKNVNLVTMTENKVLSSQTVLVSDGKILIIGAAGKISIPPDAGVIDGGGGYLMPGLADMHTHINDSMFEHPFFNLFLANGVTTIRDLAQGAPPSVLHYRREIESGKRLGPNILVAYTIWGWEKDIAGVVAGQRPLGYDCLKVNSFFTQAGFDTVMRKSKELRWYTLGHIPQLVRLDGVLAGGMNELSHIEEPMIFELLDIDLSKVTDSKSFEAELLERFHAVGKQYLNASAEEIRAAYGDRVRETVRKLEGKDITLTTTMIIHEDAMNKLVDIEKIKAAPYAKYIAPKFWQDVAAGTDKHQMMVVKGEERAWFLVYELQNMLLRELKKNNVSLVLGTDVGPTYLSLVPGFSALDELRLLTENGFSPYEAIALSTSRAGEVAGRMIGRNDFGTIEVGKRADFILLEKNPLEDIANVRNPLGVMTAGRWLPRDTLQMLLSIRHRPILDSLKAACARGGADAALERYRWFTDNNFYNEYRYGQGTLVQVGYQLLGEGRVEDALRVFRLNTEEYPADWNAYDSYGEACMKAGKKELAIESYERALVLDPTQENPRNMLRQLRQ
jgi:imidazolonepropionase-like amidohydrolase